MRKTKLPTFLFMGILAVSCAFGVYLLFQDSTGPEVTISHSASTLSPTAAILLKASDTQSPIKKVLVQAHWEGRILPVFEKRYTEEDKQQSITFSLKDTGLKEGDITLEIVATDASMAWFGQGNTTTLRLPLQIDAKPPKISIKTSQPNVRRGGSACILYAVSKEVSTTGVNVSGIFFPGHKQDNGDYLCFFAFPYYMETKDFKPEVMAVDAAGNRQVNPVDVYRINRTFKQDSINISQSFLDLKAYEFEAMAPGDMTPIERFLKVNGVVRRASTEKVYELARQTHPTMLWSGPFLRMPKAAPRAGFADHRSYMWEGQKVDEQTHLGLDLASVQHDNVPAANAGKVIFTDYLGIYGNLVIIDHGAGVHSLYSHMSEITIALGTHVQRGDILGKTGTSGMAGGDHLHFGITIGGLEVTPIEWLDPKWIRDNVTSRLKEAGLSAE